MPQRRSSDSPSPKGALLRKAHLGLTSQQVFQTKFAGFYGIQNRLNEDVIAKRFSHSFESCAGKDGLRIIKERGDSASYFSFLSPDVPTIQLEVLQAPPIAPTNPSSDECIEHAHGKLGNREIAAAKVIQKMWKIRYPIIQKRREFFASLSGQAISYIGKLCKDVAERPPLHPREIIARRAVLSDRGLYLYWYCKETEERYSEVKRVVTKRKRRAAESRSIQQMQEFQSQWETLSAIKKSVQEKAGILSEKNREHLRVSSGALGEKLDDTLEALRVINAELEMMKQDIGEKLCRYIIGAFGLDVWLIRL